MSTLLQLVNQVRSEAGVASSDLTTVQSGLSQESARFVDWVRREWLRIGTDKLHWQFLRKSNTFTTTANKSLYTPAEVGAAANTTFTAAQFRNWKLDSFRVYRSADFSDEMLAGFMPWDTYRNVYQYGSMRTNASRPVVITVAPDKSLGLGMVPDSVYTVVFEYYAAPAPLVLDADTPSMPEQFHDLIVFRALKAYASFMSAPEVMQRANEEIGRIYPKLLADQLPVPVSGPPLA